MILGEVLPPPDFKYRDIYQKSRPEHRPSDVFFARHPCMDVSRRAKIFAPFDALRGFSAEILAQNVLYENRRDMNESARDELNRQLAALHKLTANRRLAEENHIEITVTYYVSCPDKRNAAYGSRGQYQTVTGICRRVDPDEACSLFVGDHRIRLEDILAIETDADLSAALSPALN